MPWKTRKRGNKWCVVKEGETSPVPGGCHDTRAEAIRHQRALYAGENTGGALELAEIRDQSGKVIGWTMPDNGTWSLPDITTTASGSNITLQWNPHQVDGEDGAPWEAILAVEGLVSSDGRYLMPGKIEHRDLPLSLMAQTVTAEGHEGAFAAGRIDSITREVRPDLGPGAVAIVGRGVFSASDDGKLAQQLLQEEVLRHVSIDLSPSAMHFLDPETLEVVPRDDLGIAEMLNGGYVYGIEGKIMGATICAFSAFEEATMQIVDVDTDRILVASSFSMRQVLTASAAGKAPLAPPYEWFYEPEPDGPTPLTVTDDGQVYGHLALWNQCHRGSNLGCEMAPKSRTAYSQFHTGVLKTDDGRKVSVGRITVGGGHAPTNPNLGIRGAVQHYDDVGSVGAFVRASDGRHGVWLSGAVRSDVAAELVRDMTANPPSGDWRDHNGRLELCAICSVPVAGFPIGRRELALVASGQQDEQVVALVAVGYTEPEFSRKAQRRVEQLRKAARQALAS